MKNKFVNKTCRTNRISFNKNFKKEFVILLDSLNYNSEDLKNNNDTLFILSEYYFSGYSGPNILFYINYKNEFYFFERNFDENLFIKINLDSITYLSNHTKNILKTKICCDTTTISRKYNNEYYNTSYLYKNIMIYRNHIKIR